MEIKKEEFFYFGEGIKVTDYEIVKIYNDTIVVKSIENLYGLISLNSKLLSFDTIVKPKYSSIELFNENYFIARDKKENQFVINKNGNVIFENNNSKEKHIVKVFSNGSILLYDVNLDRFLCDDDEISLHDSEEELLEMSFSYCRVTPDNNILIYSDKIDKYISYNCITKSKIIKTNNYKYINSFNGLVARVNDGNKWGLINSIGNEIVPLIYDYIYPFNDDIAVFEIADQKGLIDSSGHEIIRGDYSNIKLYNNHTAKVVCSNGENKLIDTKGNSIKLDSKYQICDNLNDNSYLCVDNDGYGYLGINNGNNEIVVGEKYSNIKSIGTNIIEYSNLQKSRYIQGLINNKGEKIYESTYYYYSDFKFEEISDFIIISSKSHSKIHSIINSQGKIIMPFVELNNLFIVNDTYVIINNKLYNINNFKKLYKLNVKHKSYDFCRYFDTEEEREMAIKFYNSKKFKFLTHMKNHILELQQLSKGIQTSDMEEEVNEETFKTLNYLKIVNYNK